MTLVTPTSTHVVVKREGLPLTTANGWELGIEGPPLQQLIVGNFVLY